LATATGYDDSAFQEAIRGQSEEAFFSDFKMFTPVERTPLVTSWTVHMAFSIQEDNGAGVGEFAVVPSKTVVPADGPLQVLRAGKPRRMEIVLQAATQTRCFSRCKRVLLGAPCITNRYPSSIDERRKSYHAMMHAAKELQVTLPIDPPQRTHSLAGAFHRARAEAAIACRRYRSWLARTRRSSKFERSGRQTRCLSRASLK
jgi:hypothetical protein